MPASLFGRTSWRLWKTLIIPAIFPFWITGAVTATGGARNASIVAEVASWGQNRGVCGSANCAGNALCACRQRQYKGGEATDVREVY
jgi:hypothetical protein